MSCGHEGIYFGANYIDGICIDGYMWDLDSCETPGGPLYSGGDIACPECNHDEWLADCCEEAQDKGYLAAHDGDNNKCPIKPEKLKYPNDHAALEAAWLKGYYAAMAESNPLKQAP